MQEEKREVAPNRYPILNTYVNALSMDETVDYVKRVIARRTPPVQHVVINALKGKRPGAARNRQQLPAD